MTDLAAIETVIKNHCDAFAKAFVERDIEKLVSDFYVDTPLVIGDGVGEFRGRDGAVQYFTGASEEFASVVFFTTNIVETLSGFNEFGYVELVSRSAPSQTTRMDYFVTRRPHGENDWRVEFDYFTPGRT